MAEHSLRVLKIFTDLSKAYNKKHEEMLDAIIIVSLFHDLGKIGNINELDPASLDIKDFVFLPQNSEWHKDKLGEYYVLNEKHSQMKYPVRSLYILNFFDVKLTQQEYEMIQALNEEDRSGNLPITLFKMAKKLAIEIEKERYNKWIME